MRVAIIYIFTLVSVCNFFAETEYFDLQLKEKGAHLFQTKADSSGNQFFILKHHFPSMTTTTLEKDTFSPSLESTTNGQTKDGKYRLYGALGQIITGSSEDSAHFRLKAGFFTSDRKSVFRITNVRTRRTPISLER